MCIGRGIIFRADTSFSAMSLLRKWYEQYCLRTMTEHNWCCRFLQEDKPVGHCCCRAFRYIVNNDMNPRETPSAKYTCVAQCWAIVSSVSMHKSIDLTHNLLTATGKVMRRVIRLNGMICGIRKWSFLQTKTADPWTEDAAFSIQTKTRSGTISVEVLCSSVETHHVTALVTKSKERDGLWWTVKETIHWCTVKKLSRDARTILPNRFCNHALWFVLVECILSIAQFCGESIGPANKFETRRSRWWEGSTRFQCCFTCYGR